MRSSSMAAVAILAASITICSRAQAGTQPPASLRAAGEISFCTELGQPPAAYISTDGVTPEGFEVDIMKAIGTELGLRTRITNYDFAGILAALDANKCDAVMSSTNDTAQRREKYLFVDYMQGTSGLLVPRGNPLGLKTYEDLAGKRVAVLLGSANENRLTEASRKVVASGKSPIYIEAYPTNSAAFQQLELGRVDAFVSGSLTLSYFRSLGGGKFEIGGTPVPPSTLGIMLPKAEREKAEAIKAAYSVLLKNGTMKQIVSKWGAEDNVLLCDGTCGSSGPRSVAISSDGGASQVNRASSPNRRNGAVQFDLPYFVSFVFRPPSALLYGLGITVLVASISMAVGTGLGAILAIGGLSRYRSFRIFNQFYIGFFRGTPVLVQMVLIYFGVPRLLGGIDLFPPSIQFLSLNLSGAIIAGIVTLSLHEAAYMSEIFRAGIQSIDIGQIEAAKSLGMTPGLAMRRIILPQALRVIVPPLGNQFNTMFKTTSLLSIIAVPELFHVADAIQSATYKTFEVYLGVSVYYLALTGICTFGQRQIELRNRVTGRTATAGPRTKVAVSVG